MLSSKQKNMMKKFIFITLCLYSGLVFSQSNFGSIDKFEESKLRFHLKYLSVKPSSDSPYGGFTFNLSWHKKHSKNWKYRFMWEQTLFSDVVAGIVKKYVLKNPITKSGLDHSFSSGFFGSFQYGYNVYASDKLIIAPCFSFGDQLVAVQRFEDSNSLTPEEEAQISVHNDPRRVYRDPAGYFFIAGPAVIVNYIPKENFWIDAFLMYELTAYNVGEKNIIDFIHIEGYPNPHFLTAGFNVNHRSGLFFGTRFNSIINKGNTDTGIYRLDFNLGYNL